MQLQTQVEASEDDRETLRNAIAAAFDDDVDTAGAEIEVASTEKGLVISLQVQGLTREEKPVGDFNLALDKVLITTTDGRGTARVDLGSGLTAEGDAIVDVTEGRIDVVIENPKLLFEPDGPEVSTLEGGSDAVVEIEVAFKVGLSRLPDDAALSVQFAKVASELLDDSASVLQLVAEGAGGSIENPDDDVAFLVKVTKDGITNEDLGTNDLAMTVSKAWYDRKLLEGKAIVYRQDRRPGRVLQHRRRMHPWRHSSKVRGPLLGGGWRILGLRPDECGQGHRGRPGSGRRRRGRRVVGLSRGPDRRDRFRHSGGASGDTGVPVPPARRRPDPRRICQPIGY